MTGKSQDGNFDKTPPVGVEEYDSAIRSFCGAYEEIFKLSYCCLKASLPATRQGPRGGRWYRYGDNRVCPFKP